MSGPEHQHTEKRPAGTKGNGGAARSPGANRLLDLLASSPGGCSEALLVVHGFTGAVVTDLLDAGLATADPAQEQSNGASPARQRIRITEAGRRALMWTSPPKSRSRVGASR